MKKLMALLLSGALLLSSAALADYSDVKAGDWFYKAVNTASEKNWFSGYEDGSFKPYNNITRAEAAKVLVVYKYGGVLPDTGETQYSDINGDEWYAVYTAVNARDDIIPSAADSFKPTEYITREDTVVGMVKALGLKTADNAEDNFTDTEDISDYAKKYIAAAWENNIISGYDDGSFGAKKPVTRAEFAMILTNGENVASVPETTESPVPSATSEPTAEPVPTVDPKTTPTPSPSPVPITEDFKDKSIYIYGDKFLYRNHNWVQTVKDKLAPKNISQANNNGVRFCTTYTNNFMNNIQTIPEGTDYLLIVGGMNDWETGMAIGDEMSAAESDFTGGLRGTINTMKRRFPEAKLIIATIPNMSNVKDGFSEGGIYNTGGLSIKDYSDRMKLVCKEENVDIIDLNDKCWQLSELDKYMINTNMAYQNVTSDGDAKLAEVITEALIELNK